MKVKQSQKSAKVSQLSTTAPRVLRIISYTLIIAPIIALMGAFIYGYINDTKEHRVKDYNGAFNYCRNKNADLYITFNLAIFSYHKKEDAVGPHDPGYAAAVNKVLTPHNNAHFVYICDGDFYGQPTKP